MRRLKTCLKRWWGWDEMMRLYEEHEERMRDLYD